MMKKIILLLLLSLKISGLEIDKIHQLISDFKSGAKVDINQKFFNNKTALHQAAKEGDYHAVSILLSAGADIKAIEKCGATALHRTIMCENVTKSQRINIVRLLVARGVDQEAEYFGLKAKTMLTELCQKNFCKNCCERMPCSECKCQCREILTYLKSRAIKSLSNE